MHGNKLWPAFGIVLLTLGATAAPAFGIHPRTKGATPIRASLVTAFAPCTAPNSVHGPPLGHGSCTPPDPISSTLRVGAPIDVGKSIGYARLATITGPLGEPTEGDIGVSSNITDVRCLAESGGCTGQGADYTGELRLELTSRISDHYNTGASNPATMIDTIIDFTLPCSATGDTTIGSTCSVTSSVAARLGAHPSPDGARAMWELAPINVLDGGADGTASTAGNALFLRQGIFVP